MSISAKQAVISLLLILATSNTAIGNTSQTWHFRVLLDEKEIGHHTFKLLERDEKKHVSIQADFDVKFLFFSAYTYEHRNYEVWQGNCLSSINSRTNDNGKSFFLRGDNLGDSIQVENASGNRKLQGCVKTFSYWDPEFLKSDRLLNAQTGELMKVRVRDLGNTTINVKGRSAEARHYRIDTDEFAIELWYSTDDNQWLALKSITREGAVLEYEKI